MAEEGNAVDRRMSERGKPGEKKEGRKEERGGGQRGKTETQEAEGTSRAQAILRTTQPLGGRTNCVGA